MTERELSAIARGMAPVIRDAVAAAMEPLAARVAMLEQRAAVPGRDGRDGKDGKDGTSVSMADLAVVIAAQVEKAVASMPRPKDGVDGKDGRDGVDGKDGEPGPPGLPGPEGPAGKDGADGRAGKDGRDGTNGKDGRDGLDFTVSDIVSHSFDGERTLTLTFSRDGVTYAAPMYLSGLPIYREVFKDGESYRAGDIVTWGGGMWIARADTSEKPGTGATAWKLCVKAGRDGKQGPAGPVGPPGPRGEKGDRGPDRW